MNAGTETEAKFHDQLNEWAYMIDGVTAIIETYIMYADELSISRQAPVLVDALERVNLQLSALAMKFQPANAPVSEIVARLEQHRPATLSGEVAS